MLKTLKLIPGITTAVGSVQVQPLNSVAFIVKQAASQQSSATAVTIQPSSVPLADTSVADQNAANKDFKSETNLSTSEIANKLVTSPTSVISDTVLGKNTVLPSYISNVTPRSSNKNKQNKSQAPSREIQPYELLSGIAYDRPEIVLMSQFLPLFDTTAISSAPDYLKLLTDAGIDPTMTNAGIYANIQMQARNLRVFSAVHGLKSIAEKELAVKLLFAKKKSDLQEHMESLQKLTQFYLGLIADFNRMREQLDLRDPLFTVDTQDVLNEYVKTFTQEDYNFSSTSALAYATKYLPEKYDVVDALVRLGYSKDSVSSKFASTKLWLQLLNDYKKILKYHSAEFIGIKSATTANDTNPIVIAKPDYPLFSFSSSDPVGFPGISAIIASPPEAIQSLVNSTSKAYASIYKFASGFKSAENRIAALLNLVCKEYKYSRGLKDYSTQNVLSKYYGYSVSDNTNTDVFDAVLGPIGNSISDIPQFNNNSLVNIAQQQPAANVAVLTFESKYLARQKNSYTPGSAFYVDHVLDITDDSKFQTQRLDNLANLLRNAYEGFSTLANNMNLLTIVETGLKTNKKYEFGKLLADPIEFQNKILEKLVTTNGKPSFMVESDNLSSIYTFASSDTTLKSMMFLLVLNQVTRAYEPGVLKFISPAISDNTPLTDKLIDAIAEHLVSNVKTAANTKATGPLKYAGTDVKEIDILKIKSSLKDGTQLHGYVQNLMSQVLVALQDEAFVADRTRYSGQLDSTVTLAIFDAIISIIARYSNQKLVGKKTGAASYKFFKPTLLLISRSNTDLRPSLVTLKTKLSQEVTLEQQLAYTIMNVLFKLANSADSFSKQLKSQVSTGILKDTLNLVDGDVSKLKALVDEQQIMLISSTVQDVLGKLKSQVTLPTYSNNDVNGDNKYDSDDEIKLLDESYVSPQLKASLFEFLRQPSLSQKPAFNKRVLSVGIPLGFTKHLKERVDLDSKNLSFAKKQADIIAITVYKTDMLNQDIIYKPKKFLFELSRFPVRNDAFFKDVAPGAGLAKVLSAIPTRDFDESIEEGTSPISYWQTGNLAKTSKNNALSADSYNFLTFEQKQEIIQNHVTSYLLESYINVMTGINISETSFSLHDVESLVESDFVSLVLANRAQQAIDFVKLRTNPIKLPFSNAPTDKQFVVKEPVLGGAGQIFTFTTKPTLPTNLAFYTTDSTNPEQSTASGKTGKLGLPTVAKNIPQDPTQQQNKGKLEIPKTSFSDLMKKMSAKKIPQLKSAMKQTSDMKHLNMSISDGILVSKKLLQPKQFDRVFNIIVDPDEFEIDYDKVVETDAGKIALKALLQQGNVVPVDQQNSVVGMTPKSSVLSKTQTATSPSTVQGSSPTNSYKYRDRDKQDGDLMLERYFVTIETFGDEVV